MPVSRTARAPERAPEGAPERAPARAPRHWLLKSEPDVFGFDDLLAAPDRTTCWDGIRNYQARNYMRDDMCVGDMAFFYHSNADPAGVAGIVEVVRDAYPDPTAFDPASEYFDPKSRPDAPTWLMVDVRAVEPLPTLVTLDAMRGAPGLEEMLVLRRGNRLSVTPVTPEEWRVVCELGGLGGRAAGRPAAGVAAAEGAGRAALPASGRRR